MVFTKTGPKWSGRKGSYVGHHWFDDIVVIPEEDRIMPATIPHDVVAEHVFGCQCDGCTLYPTPLLRRLKRARLSASAQR